MHRRQLLAGMAGAATAALIPARISAQSLIAAPMPDQTRIIEIAKRELERGGSRIWLRDQVGIADFSIPSHLPRFFTVDMVSGKVRPYLVTHGRGSDPEHDGWLKSFSNDFGSNATSRGAYVTRTWYEGKHNNSMRLIGLDPDNSRAEDRAIVIHSAWYAEPEVIAQTGRLGRSEGCFVFPQAKLPEILSRLGPGRLLFADRLNLLPYFPPAPVPAVTGVGTDTGLGATDGNALGSRGLSNDASTGPSRPYTSTND